MLFNFLFLISLLSCVVQANSQEQALHIVNKSKSLTQKEALAFVESLSEAQKPHRQDSRISSSSKPACKGQIARTAVDHPPEEILVFVSFSIPDEALKALFDQAHKYKARLVLKGLVDDSFKKTQAKIQFLQINVDIDPNLFEEHHITHVPTFVKVHKDKIFTLKGHVSLPYVYEQFEKALRGDACS